MLQTLLISALAFAGASSSPALRRESPALPPTAQEAGPVAPGEEGAIPLPPQAPAAVAWELVSEVRLEVPEGTSFILRSVRFLQDGTLVMKRGRVRNIELFGADGTRLDEWTPPRGQGDWRRISFGTFLGEARDTLWFLPGHNETLPAPNRAYRLWREKGHAGARRRELVCRRVVEREGGMWLAKDMRVEMLDPAFKVLRTVVDEEGEPLVVAWPQMMRVDSRGTLAILDGHDSTPTCCGNIEARPYRVHVISPAGKRLRCVEFPQGVCQNVAGFGFEGGRLFFSRHVTNVEQQTVANSLHELDLESGACKRVLLSDGAFLTFGRGNARLLDAGRTLKVFDSKAGAVRTYRALR